MRFKMFALTNARPGREEEYERWSKDRHLADVLAVPGVVSGECFRLTAPAGQWQYFTLYEVETEDPGGLLQEISSRVGTDAMPMSASLDSKTSFMGLFEPR